MSYLRLDNISLNDSRFRILQVLSLTVILLASLTARAQLDKGAVTGTLRDASGSVLPGASVTVRNTATGIATTVTTNADVTYQVLALNPGTYSIEASAPGFGTAKNPEVEIHVKSRAEVDFTMQLGAVSQQVEVRDTSAALQTQSADVGTTIGTNSFHGNVWEYARNSVFDSNTYLNRQKKIPKDAFSQNQFGGTIGGPTFHDRTFFFADYQGLRSSQRVTKSSVPSARMKVGDFGELSPTVYSLRSVATGQAGCLSSATMTIAASCLDPVALKLAALFPIRTMLPFLSGLAARTTISFTNCRSSKTPPTAGSITRSMRRIRSSPLQLPQAASARSPMDLQSDRWQWWIRDRLSH